MRLPVCKASSRDLVLVSSFDADQSHKLQNLLQPINISAPCRFVRSAALICTQVRFMAKQLSVFAPDVHLCVIKVTPRKYLSGWLIETEGRGIDQEATAKTSQHSQPGARPNTPARNLDLHEIPRTPLFHLNLETPTVGWLSAYLSVLCVLFLFLH